MIGIIDYGQGNLGSIKNMLWRLGEDSLIISKPEELVPVSKIILPGVGTYDTGMKNLTDGGWIDALIQKVSIQEVPTLGVCLGMQLLTKYSEEGQQKGLGFINGFVKKFKFNDRSKMKVPHMGWNTVKIMHNSKIIKNLYSENRFYFAHSYYVLIENQNQMILQTSFGFDFTSGFEVGNIIGLQFHPEKSHKFGMAILKNFINEY